MTAMRSIAAQAMIRLCSQYNISLYTAFSLYSLIHDIDRVYNVHVLYRIATEMANKLECPPMIT